MKCAAAVRNDEGSSSEKGLVRREKTSGEERVKE